MAKLLKDILKAAHDTIKGVHKSTTEPLSVGKDPGVDLAPKAGDDNNFIAKHSVEKWDEPYGNPNYADKVGYSLEKEKNHGNTISKAKAANEEVQIDELSQNTMKSYKAAAQDDKKNAERQAKHSEHTAKFEPVAKRKKEHEIEAGWLKSIAAKRAKGIKMADKKIKEETEVSESKKAEDIKCNMSEAGTRCPMHEMADCSSARTIKELSTDTYHKAAHKAAKMAMTDVQGRSGPIFKKRAAQANKFRAKGMDQEKKEKAMKEAVAPGQFSKPSDAAKAKVKQIQQKDADKAAVGRAKMGIKSVDEAMGSSTIKHKQNISYMSDKEFAAKYKDRSDAELRSMAWRHGHGKPGTPGHEHYVNRRKKGLAEEVELDEKHLTPAEMKKREEVAQAIHRENPKMPMSKKMAIATSTAKKVAEDLAVPLLGGDQNDDESAEMAKAELKAIANQAMNLVMQIPDTMIIEPWVQSKIAQAKVMISGVHDYMIYGDHDKQKETEGTMDTPMTFPNMSVDVNTGQNV